MRGALATGCSVLTIPVFGILSFTNNVNPLIAMLWLGFTYSVAAVSPQYVFYSSSTCFALQLSYFASPI